MINDASAQIVVKEASSEFPSVVATSAGNVLVHFLGSLRTQDEAVIRTQLDLGQVEEAVRTHIGSMDLSKIDEKEVLLHVGHSQTLKGKFVALKQPIALLRPQQITTGTLEAELVHFELYFGTAPMPRVQRLEHLEQS